MQQDAGFTPGARARFGGHHALMIGMALDHAEHTSPTPTSSASKPRSRPTSPPIPTRPASLCWGRRPLGTHSRRRVGRRGHRGRHVPLPTAAHLAKRGEWRRHQHHRQETPLGSDQSRRLLASRDPYESGGGSSRVAVSTQTHLAATRPTYPAKRKPPSLPDTASSSPAGTSSPPTTTTTTWARDYFIHHDKPDRRKTATSADSKPSATASLSSKTPITPASVTLDSPHGALY